jgi:hypothetical protein
LNGRFPTLSEGFFEGAKDGVLAALLATIVKEPCLFASQSFSVLDQLIEKWIRGFGGTFPIFAALGGA